MNVYHRTTHFPKETLAEDLHVPSQDDEPGTAIVDNPQLVGLGFRLLSIFNGKVVEGQTISFCRLPQVGMIGNDTDKIAPQLARFPSKNEIVEAVIGLGNHEDDSRSIVSKRHARLHAQVVSSHNDEPFGLGFLRTTLDNVPFNSLKENVFLLVKVLVGVYDVATALVNPPRNLRHYSRAVGTVQQCYQGHD